MIPFSSLTFNITGVPEKITPGHPLWQEPLAGRSAQFAGGLAATHVPDRGSWTIGAYFLSARAFISRRQVLDNLAGALGPDLKDPAHWEVVLDLQKHGAFYHPIKMVVASTNSQSRATFVLNGAVSDHGRELARKEKRLFSLLEQRLCSHALPAAYDSGEVTRPGGPVGFFLAQWLEDYYEFHVTESRQRREVVVWRPGQDNLYLPMDQALPAYENIARVLTRAYDPATGGQVLFWHHGAGDFILAPDKTEMPVKLITVREYGSLVDQDLLEQGPLPGLFLFFVHLCFRIRLDRLDGVGSPVFLGQDVLAAAVRGFFKGLGAPGNQENLSPETVWNFFKTFTRDQILMALEQMLEVWPPGPSERGLVERKINDFAGQTRDLFKSGAVSDFY